MNNNKVFIIIVLVVIVAAAGAGALYFYVKRQQPAMVKEEATGALVPASDSDELSGVRLYYPMDGSLQMKERRLPRRSKQTGMAEAILEEYFRGPGNGASNAIPREVKIMGLYRDAAQMLYVDLSDEFRRNFQGDALAEYLVLKGIYESLMTNVQDIQDIKILVEGKEIESMGGHFSLKFPLKNIISADAKGARAQAGE